MGREIRRVPAGWEHPRQYCRHSPWAGGCDEAKAHGGYCLKPLYDHSYEEAARDWMAEFRKWDALPVGHEDKGSEEFFWDWHGTPPDKEYYRPAWTDEERTHYQIYETASEGTPVSPVFASLEEMTEWLVSQGTSRHAAESFAKSGWVPSMVIHNGPDGARMASNFDTADL